MTGFLFLLCLGSAFWIAYLFHLARQARARHEAALADIAREKDEVARKHQELQERLRPVLDVDAERQKVIEETNLLRVEQNEALARAQAEVVSVKEDRARTAADLTTLRSQIDALRKELATLEGDRETLEFGFYKPRFDYDTSERFVQEIDKVRSEQKQMISAKTAATCTTKWEVNGSVVEGRKQITRTLKLALRAFNGECDAALSKVRYNNIATMEARINKAFDAVNEMISIQSCSLSRSYLTLKLRELYLTHEHQEKIQEEKEEQRRIREQIREEEQAQREMEKARLDAEREEERFVTALEKARGEVANAHGAAQERLAGKIADLERLLEEARANKERAIARAQMTRSGHVYVISNIGSFGENVYKLGMTRRLDPMERVRELGDASVPFLFDVHAVIFSEDAPGLEAKLHKHFQERRVNRINERREFFRVGLDDIAEAVKKFHGEIEFTKVAEAAEYRKTLALEHAPEMEFGFSPGNTETAPAAPAMAAA